MDCFLAKVKSNLENISSFDHVHVVIGNEACDLDSTVSAVTYAYFLHCKNQREATASKSTRDRTLTVPVLNIYESQFRLRTETTYFFKKCQINSANLIFKDQIDFKSLYEDKKLVLTLVDHNILTGEHTPFEQCVREVIDHHVRERTHDDRVKVKLDFVGSCSTLVAEELLDDPDFVIDEITGELLYGTILVDTINRSVEAGKITVRDENVLQRLGELFPGINGDKLFNELQEAKFDISGLLNMEILEKDLKRLAGTAMSIAMSSVTMDMEELIHRENFKEDLNKFCKQENCDVVVIMTLVNNEDNKPTRQIAVYSENRIFRDQIADTLDNSDEVNLELDPIMPPFKGISVFHQGNIKASRKKVMPILKSFLVGDKTPEEANKDFISVHTVSTATNAYSSVVGNQGTSDVHFNLDSIEIPSGDNSFYDNNNSTDLGFLGENGDSEKLVNNFENTKTLGFDPLATISSMDEESPPKELPDDSIFGNSQNPFGESLGNSGKVSRNPTKDLSVNYSSTHLSSAQSSNIFDLGISDSELVDPFSSVDESAPQDNREINSKDTKLQESIENDIKDTQELEGNLLGLEIHSDADDNKNLESSNPFINFVDASNDITSESDIKFQLDEGDDSITYDSSIKEDNSVFSDTSSMNPFSSGAFLEVDAFKSEHPLAYKSPSLIVEFDDKSQADDLADLEESELYDKIPTPEIENSGESSPFVMSETGTPYEYRSERHSRTGSESGYGNTGTTVPPNSLMDQGFEDTDHQLPSFNNAEMVERINRKKASLGDLLSLEESAEGNIDASVPYTPANSFRDSSMESLMHEKRLPDFPSDTEMLSKVQQKRDSLQANIDFSDNFVDQSNPFDPYSLRGDNFNKSSSMDAANITSSSNPFFQLDENSVSNDNTFAKQSVGFTSLDQTDQYGSSDVFNLFNYTGRSNSTSLDNQVGSETGSGSQDLFDISEFETQSTQSGQNLNPFIDDPFSVNSSSISKEQTVLSNSNSKSSPFPHEYVDQSVLDDLNDTANLEAADTVSESVAKEIIHDAIESFPNIKNAYVANNMFPPGDPGSNAFWAQQGSSDSGIGSTDSPQQVTRVKPTPHRLHSEVSVETEYLPGMDPLHGSLNIVTSPASHHHTIETDADKEVVEGESFRKISEVIRPELSIFSHQQPSHFTQPSTRPTNIPEQICKMIITKNILTTAENIQTSTDVDRVISPEYGDGVISPENDVQRVVSPVDADGVISPENEVERVISPVYDGVISPENEVENEISSEMDRVTSLLDKNVAPLNVTESENSDSKNIVQLLETEPSLMDIDKGDINDSNEVVEPDVMDSNQTGYNNEFDNEAIDINSSAAMLGDADHINQSEIETEDTQELNEKVFTLDNGNDAVSDNGTNQEPLGSPIVSCISDYSISSDTSSSFQSTSESELITVKENSHKVIDGDSKVTENQVETHISENDVNIGTSDNAIFENNDLVEINDDSELDKSEERSCSKLADKLVNETLAQVLEEEKERIVKEREVSEKIIEENKVDEIVTDYDGLSKTGADLENGMDIDTMNKVNAEFDTLDKTDAEFDNLGITDKKFDTLDETDADNDNVDVDTRMKESLGDWTQADKQFKSETSDIIAEQTPVLINSCMTESVLTFESVSPLDTPLDEYAGGFYEINPDIENKTGVDDAGREKNDADSDLNDSTYETNLGDNETGFYDFGNANEDNYVDDNEDDDGELNKNNEDGDVVNVEHVATATKSHMDIIKNSYENNADKLNSAIDNSNMRFLTLDDEYSDNSVSPMETPETEHATGFFDLNADSLELAIAKTESLDVNRSMFESIYSDSSMSPAETPDEESVGGFYQFNSESTDNVASNVAKQQDLNVADTLENDVARSDTANTIETNLARQPVTDDIPEINIELVDTPVSSKDSFDSETESCFEERVDGEHGEANKDTKDDKDVTKNRSVRFDESTKFGEEFIKRPEPVTTPESDMEGFYELDIEASGNPFSPIESPSEEMFTLNFESKKFECNVQGGNNEITNKQVKFEDNENIVEPSVEEIADTLVDKAFNEAITTLHGEGADSNSETRLEDVTVSNDVGGGLVNKVNFAEIEAENVRSSEVDNTEIVESTHDEKLIAVADKLVNEAMSSAIELVSDINEKSEGYSRQVVPEPSGMFSDSSDSETSSTTTEGSYRIDHSSDLATPDRDLIPEVDPVTNLNPTVDEYSIGVSGMVEQSYINVPKDFCSNVEVIESNDAFDFLNDAQKDANNVENAPKDNFSYDDVIKSNYDALDSQNDDKMESVPIENFSENSVDDKDFTIDTLNTSHSVENENDVSSVQQASLVETLTNENRENVIVEASNAITDTSNADNDENKENKPIPVDKTLNKNAEVFSFDEPLVGIYGDEVIQPVHDQPLTEVVQPIAAQPLKEDAPQRVEDDNGNYSDGYLQEHDVTTETEYTEYEYEEEDTNTSRYDEDTNTSMDIKSPDGPSYYKYDSFELDDKDVSEKTDKNEKADKNEKGKTLNRQGTIIPDIVISMDDTPSAFDETMRVRKLGNYKPEIIDLSHETEDEISEKEESCESDNASEISVDTQLPVATVDCLIEVTSATSDTDNENLVNVSDNKTRTEHDKIDNKLNNDFSKEITQVKAKDRDNNASSDKNKHAEIDEQPRTIDSDKDNVKYHNVKDIEGDKQSKKTQKSNKAHIAGKENKEVDTFTGDNEEYVTRKEIFYTSAGKLSISIDSVVDPRSDSDPDVEEKKQEKNKDFVQAFLEEPE